MSMSFANAFEAAEAEEDMLQRALGVGDGGGEEEDEEDDSAPPTTGEEYLRRVMREAKRLDDVATGESGGLKSLE